MRRVWRLACVVWALSVAGAWSQEKAPADQFKESLTQWKSVIKDLRGLRDEYAAADAAKKDELKKRWDDLVAQGEQLLPKLRDSGAAAFAAAPNADKDLSGFLVRVLADDVRRDAHESAFGLAKALADGGTEIKEVYPLAGVAAFCTNDYAKAREWFAKAKSLGAKDELADKFESQVDATDKLWQKEQEARAKEKEADDLPRVKLETSKGPVVIELFENEAPGAVGNFVHLVEQKYYDGLTFHRVLPHFMIQGGCPKGDGTGGPGYTIYCECEQPNARKHFRGSLSMAHAGKDTGGSQFFLNLVPTDHLNGRHTVFGRVIEGLDVLAKIERKDPESPSGAPADKIVKAEVVRKRPKTEYVPKKVSK